MGAYPTGTVATPLERQIQKAHVLASDSIIWTSEIRGALGKSPLTAAIKSIGLKLFASEEYGSPAITSIGPNNFDAEEFRKEVKSNYDILLAGGQDHLKGKIFRIGHLGFISDRDILTAIAAIESTMDKLGVLNVKLGTGVSTASKILMERN